MPAAKKRSGAKKAASAPPQVIGKRVKLTLDERRGKETLTLETPHGQTIVLSDAHASIHIRDSSGNQIRLDPGGITIEAAARVSINAAEVKVNAANARFSGIVQCETLISNSVVSASYTPGAGNLW